MKKGLGLAVVLGAVLTIGGAARQDVPAVTENHGGFAFPNPAGTEIIVVHDIARPAEIHTAICAGRMMPVRFVRRQFATSAHGDRDSPEQFADLTGTVFEIVGERTEPQDTCFVAADSLVQNAELLPIQPSDRPAECTPGERRGFAALRQRRIKSCWSLARIRPRGLIGLVEYDRIGRSALASVIVLTSDRGISADFPAEYRGEGEEVWRAGDGGGFSPDGFHLPFIIRRTGTYVVAVDWEAEEGHSLSLYESRPQAATRQLIHDYWYRAPR
jgi:hypothetical protein